MSEIFGSAIDIIVIILLAAVIILAVFLILMNRKVKELAGDCTTCQLDRKARVWRIC